MPLYSDNYEEESKVCTIAQDWPWKIRENHIQVHVMPINRTSLIKLQNITLCNVAQEKITQVTINCVYSRLGRIFILNRPNMAQEKTTQVSTNWDLKDQLFSKFWIELKFPGKYLKPTRGSQISVGWTERVRMNLTIKVRLNSNQK